MVCHFNGDQRLGRVSGSLVAAAFAALALACSSSSSSTAADAGSSAPSPSAPKHLSGLPSGDWIESVAYSSDGASVWAASELQVGGATGETLGWAVSSGAMLPAIDGPAWSVATAPSGSNLAVGGPAVTVDTPQATSVKTEMTLMGASGAVGYSHDGKWIAAAAPATGQVIVFSAADGSVVAQVAHPTVTNERIWRVTFSADDSMLATCSGQNGLGSPHGSTYVWSTAGFSQLTQITCTTFDAAFSSDGSELALACWVDAKIFSTKGWAVTHALELPNSGNAMSVAFSPDGSKLAVGVFEGGVQLFSPSTGATLMALTDGTAQPTIKGLAFSPDGSTVAGGGWDDSIVRLWSGF